MKTDNRSGAVFSRAAFSHLARAVNLFGVALLAFALTACSSSDRGETASGLIVVNSPATGVVRRVLVSEGAAVKEGAAIIEIAAQSKAQAEPKQQTDPQSRARSQYTATQKEFEAAQAEAERAAVEAQRIEQLVASGAAPQAQLDAARAQYQQAQERLQREREATQSARRNLVIRQGGGEAAIPGVNEKEQIVAARASTSGVLRVLNARVGQFVTTGQPIATISTDDR